MSVSKLFRGAKYALAGVRFYLTHREYWKEAAVPLLILAAVYLFFAIVGCWAAVTLGKALLMCLANWPQWLQGVAAIIGICFLIFWPFFILTVIVGTVSFCYETIGGIMFDSLVAAFEKRARRIPAYRRSKGYCARFILESCLYSCRTAILLLLLTLAAMFIPVVGPVVQFAILGYRYAISALSNVAYNRGLLIRDLKRSASGHTSVVLGYGVTCYALMLVPFLSIIMYPGLMIGGAMLYEQEFEGGTACRSGKLSDK